MKHLTLTSVLAALTLAPHALAQQTPEAQKSASDRKWKFVVTNDNLQEIIKNSKISVVGNPAAVSAPASQPAPSVSSSPKAANRRAIKRFIIEITGVCDNRPFVIPTWCPRPGPDVAGGLYREIQVNEGDDVKIELVPSLLWNSPPVHSFVLTAAEPIEACLRPDGKVDPGQEQACSQFPQFGVSYQVSLFSGSRTIEFVADKAGTYKYYDGLNPGSGYGLLTVR